MPRYSLERLLAKTNALILLGSAAILVFVVMLGGSIAGSYALTLATVHHTQGQITAAEQLAKNKAVTLEIKSAQGTCKALVTLDDSKDGIVFKPSDNGASSHYLKALIKGISGVVSESHCRDLLSGNFHVVDGQLVPGKAHR